MQLGCPFRSRWVVTTVQPSSLGTIAIGIDGGQSSNDDSFSRKIQIRSVLEILVFANGQTPFSSRDLEENFQPTQRRSRFNLTSQPYQVSSPRRDAPRRRVRSALVTLAALLRARKSHPICDVDT